MCSQNCRPQTGNNIGAAGSDLFEPLLLLSDYVLDHHGDGVNPGDHHAQRHHVLNHKQKAEKAKKTKKTQKLSRDVTTSTARKPEKIAYENL